MSEKPSNIKTYFYEYNITDPKTGKTRVKKVQRNYNLLGQDSKYHKLQPDEVRKEYIYRGRKIVRYYKVKNANRESPTRGNVRKQQNGPISNGNEQIECNIPGSCETESIQQIAGEQKVAETGAANPN
jgi:hypothetical protein